MNWTLLQNSFFVSGLATIFSLAIGFAAALWLAALGPKWRHGFLAGAVIALALPPFQVTNCWLYFLGLTGVWRGWLPWNIYSLGGAVWILTLLTWPISLLAALSAWKGIEAAQLECEPALRGTALVRWLLWPTARPSLGLAAALTSVLALNNFAVPAILQVKVFPAEVWVRFSTNFDATGALALSWPLLAAPVLLLLLWWRAEIAWPRQTGSATARAFRRQLGPGMFWACSLVGIAALCLSVGLPLAQIVSEERTWTELPKVVRAVRGVIWNSAGFAAATAFACAVLGAVACRTAKRERGRVASLSVGLTFSFLWLPLLVPGVLLGIGLILAFNRPVFEGIYQSAGMVLIAWTIRFLGLSCNGTALALQAVDHELVDVARLEGAAGWPLWRVAYWPQIAPRVATAWYLIYLLCLWDVETIVLIYPPGGETLALRIFNLLHYGHNAQVNALCLLLLLLAAAPLALWTCGQWLTGRQS
jgi:ABC-type Fe3+ transport system permease subunit